MAWSIGMNDTSMGDGESVAGPPEADHHNNFDFIRFVAASFVLISHSYPLLGRSDEPFKAFVGYETGGEIAVAIFFVISGYLVTGSFLRSLSKGDYIKKRSLRLLPALCLVVVLSAFVLGPILSTLSLRDYVLHPQTWSYLRNCVLDIAYHFPGVFAENPHPHTVNGSIWTLPVEAVMYILVLLLGWGGLITPTILLSAMLGLALLQFTLIDYFDLSHVVLFQLFLLAPSVKLGLFFLSGSLLYVLRDRLSVRSDVACVMVLALVGTFRTSIGPLIFQLTLPYLTIWAAHANLKRLSRFGRFGDFSYGIYLFAFPVQQVLVHTMGTLHVGLFALLTFLITLPLAVVSWYWVEKPALAWKTRPLRPWGPRLPVGV